MALGEWGVRKCPLWEAGKGQNEGQKGENMAMPPHKPSVFAGCRNKQQKTALWRGFLSEYLFYIHRMRYDPITDTIQFFLQVGVQRGSDFLGRVQRAKIR